MKRTRKTPGEKWVLLKTQLVNAEISIAAPTVRWFTSDLVQISQCRFPTRIPSDWVIVTNPFCKIGDEGAGEREAAVKQDNM